MTKKKEEGFEEQLGQLEAIVGRLDSDDMSLEKAIESYEAGIKLSLVLNKTLAEAQQKIEILTRTARGEYEAKPFDEVSNA